nr:hypothetical protein [Geminicoccus roseus]
MYVDLEVQRLRAVYGEYEQSADSGRWDIRKPGVCEMRKERARLTLQLLQRRGFCPLGLLDILEIGCGDGDNRLNLLGWGRMPGGFMVSIYEKKPSCVRERACRVSICGWRTPRRSASGLRRST